MVRYKLLLPSEAFRNHMIFILTGIIGIQFVTLLVTIFFFLQKIERLTTQFMVIKGTGSAAEAQILWKSMEKDKVLEKEEKEDADSQLLADAIDNPKILNKAYQNLSSS